MTFRAWKRWGVAGIGALALILASCGSATQAPTASPTSHPTTTATPAPTPTPTPAGPLAACLTAPVGGLPALWGYAVTEGSNVEVVGTGGTVLNQAPLSYVSSAVPVSVGVGQAGLYFYDKSTGELSVLGKTGAAQDLGTITPTGGWNNADNISLAESPNGQCWVLSLISYDANAVSTSQIYVGGAGISPTLVTTVTRPNLINGVVAGGYQPLRWDASGVLLGAYPTEVGGAGPFIGESYSFAIVVRLNLQTDALSAPLCTGGQFADEASDGTLACIAGLNADAKIEVSKNGGSTTTIDTGSESAGEVAFVGGSSLLTYCTAATTGSGWSESLLAVGLGGQSPSPKTVAAAVPDSQLEGPFAWYKLVGATSIAEILGTSGSTSLAEVSLTTGQATTITPADSLLGVL